MRVSIAGASGYAGGELLRLLEGHPTFHVIAAAAHPAAGSRIDSVHPSLAPTPIGSMVMCELTVRQWSFEQFSPWMECLLDIQRSPIASCRRSAQELPTPSKVQSIEWYTTSLTNLQAPLNGNENHSLLA